MDLNYLMVLRRVAFSNFKCDMIAAGYLYVKLLSALLCSTIVLLEKGANFGALQSGARSKARSRGTVLRTQHYHLKSALYQQKNYEDNM